MVVDDGSGPMAEDSDLEQAPPVRSESRGHRAPRDLTEQFEEALRYATRLHRRQARKGTDIPYLAHLLAVTALVLEHGGDEEQGIAALLHDAVEDQGGDATLEEIRRRFGDRVAELVLACSDTLDTPKPPWRGRKEDYIARIAEEPEDALLVTLADKVHNARSIQADYRLRGEEVWDRFSGARDGTLWYYRALIDAISGRKLTEGGAELLRQLDETVSSIEAAVSGTLSAQRSSRGAP